MVTGIDIHAATPAGAGAIGALLVDAFGGPVEKELVAELRLSGDLLLERIAVELDEVVGHVACCRLQGSWGDGIAIAALAPLAVRADRRQRGIGAALVGAALGELRAGGCDIVLVLGDPDFYARFGFSPAADFGLRTPYDGLYQHALALSARGRAVRGLRVSYPGAFVAVD